MPPINAAAPAMGGNGTRLVVSLFTSIGPMSTTFTAYVARNDDGNFSRGIEQMPVEELGTGGVLIRVQRSSVNYKDSLAASAKGRVARISPETGRVVRWIDLRGLMSGGYKLDQEAVLNGIAHDPARNRLFVTGKLWPRLFEIEIMPRGRE